MCHESRACTTESARLRSRSHTSLSASSADTALQREYHILVVMGGKCTQHMYSGEALEMALVVPEIALRRHLAGDERSISATVADCA